MRNALSLAIDTPISLAISMLDSLGFSRIIRMSAIVQRRFVRLLIGTPHIPNRIGSHGRLFG